MDILMMKTRVVEHVKTTRVEMDCELGGVYPIPGEEISDHTRVEEQADRESQAAH